MEKELKKEPGEAGAPQAPAQIGYWELHKYSTRRDKCVTICGLVFSLLAGIVLPCYAIILETVIAAFDPDLPTDEKAEKLRGFIWGVIAICIATYFTSYIGYACMQISAERLSFKLRARYLASLMKQEIPFFEK